MQEIQRGKRQELAKNSDKNPRTLIAVIEPLERGLRAQFGQHKKTWSLIAVMAPLEGALRARLGQIIEIAVKVPFKGVKGHQKGNISKK